MALNKARTSIGIKILIIVLIIAFVSLFMYQGVAGIIDLFKQPEAAQTQKVDYVAALQQQNQPGIDALKKVVASNPTSYTAQVTLANELYNWSDQLSRPQQGQSQLTTAAMTAAFQKWAETKAAYDTANKLMKTFDPAMQTDRSYATLESGDTTGALVLISEVTKKAPTFAQGWAHLGMYFEALGMEQRALPMYKKYLQLDPKGTNTEYIKKRVATIEKSASASGTASTTTKKP